MAQDPNDPSDEDHTSIFVGKAEPGRDIFAGEPVKDIKSQAVPEDQLPIGDKEISSVLLTQQITATALDSETTATEAQEESIAIPLAAEPSAEANAPTQQDLPADNATEMSTEDVASTEQYKEDSHVAKKPAGPLGEAEVEAEKVAQELYPDAVDED